MMTKEEFTSILSLGHELTGIEFKGPGLISDKHLFAKVTEAILGMANRRDGGRIVIGVHDNAGVLEPTGMSKSDAEAWKYDDVAGKLAEYADPSVSFNLEIQEHNSKYYVTLTISEFEDIPVLCKKDYPDVLRKGACYVRTRRKPETTEIPTQEDMRDLLDLATEKSLRKILKLVSRTGGLITPSHPGNTIASQQELFDKQIGVLK